MDTFSRAWYSRSKLRTIAHTFLSVRIGEEARGEASPRATSASTSGFVESTASATEADLRKVSRVRKLSSKVVSETHRAEQLDEALGQVVVPSLGQVLASRHAGSLPGKQ